uniref:Uncharacterized protein n=1 Tax=Avena sativa TaxID=4498 RepID=A0ACD5ZKQ0_AVESA
MAHLLVSASTGAMRSVIRKLGAMLRDEYRLLKGVRSDIKFLKDELEAMHAFLLVMADVEQPDKQATLRANAVRELSYDMEDKIDKFIVLIDHEPSSKSDSSFKELFNKSMKKITSIKTRHNIAKDIKDIMSQVSKVSERHSRYKIDESSKAQNARVDPRIVAVYKDAAELVGIDGPRDEIVKWMSDKECESSHRPNVVSIVGCGGLGKTTLAKQVYDKLGAYFECRAFVSISRTPDMIGILSCILSEVSNGKEHARASYQQIVHQIRKILTDKRYLIIIDDVWDVQTWELLYCALIKNDCGSVIMTTTRINSVAKSCCSSDGDLVYKIHPLGIADSKKLFFKRIFGCEEKCPPSLREASEDILKKCGGLPLAINTISSMLATGKTKEEWGRVRSSIGFAQGRSSDIDAMSYILSLSYLDLPLYLRSCLLYLTMFPEDYEVGMEQLVHRWIFEGLIHGEDDEDLVELGETYFHELVNRSLIQPRSIWYNGKARSCQVHDTILDFLIYKSSEENFCTLLSNHSKPDSVVRRLPLMGNEDRERVEQLDLSHARSLAGVRYSQDYLPSLARLNALRVLDVHDCTGLGNHHVRDIGKLVQLRYLNISRTKITELPKEIGDLEFLEMLDASKSGLHGLPESVTRLKRLARLFVPEGTKLPDGIGNMENLQELGHNIDIYVQSMKFLEGLGRLTNLRWLRICWDTIKHGRAPSKGEKLVSSLRKLDSCKLRSLRIMFYLREEDGIAGHPSFPALGSIRKITLCRGQLSWIAKWLVSVTNLEKLFIKGTEMEQQDIEVLGSMPRLLELRAESNRTEGRTITIFGAGFQRLQMLVYNAFATELMFEARAIPNLKELYLGVRLRNYRYGGAGCGFNGCGIDRLSGLAWLHVGIDCRDGKASDLEAAKGVFKSMVDAHPNRPTLEMYTTSMDMLQNE